MLDLIAAFALGATDPVDRTAQFDAQIDAILTGELAAEEVDLAAWRFGDETSRAAFERLRERQSGVYRAAYEARRTERGLPEDAANMGCLDHPAARANGAIFIASAGENAESQAEIAEAAYAFARRLNEDLDQIETLDADPDEAWTMLRDAAASAEGPVRGLQLRAARDQYARASFSRLGAVPAEARTSVERVISAKMCSEDLANTAWLDRNLDALAQLDLDEGALSTVWIIAQHADHDPSFQQRALDFLTAQEASSRNIAFLTDRVRRNRGLPQLYATQGRCVEAGAWRYHPVEDPDGLAERLEAAGLPPIEQRLALMGEVCRDFDPG